MTSEQDTAAILPILGNVTYREWHAFVNGFYVGYVGDDREHEYDREKHYWRAGYISGDIVRGTDIR